MNESRAHTLALRTQTLGRTLTLTLEMRDRKTQHTIGAPHKTPEKKHTQRHTAQLNAERARSSRFIGVACVCVCASVSHVTAARVQINLTRVFGRFGVCARGFMLHRRVCPESCFDADIGRPHRRLNSNK